LSWLWFPGKVTVNGICRFEQVGYETVCGAQRFCGMRGCDADDHSTGSLAGGHAGG
jgi:hypothetical protein